MSKEFSKTQPPFSGVFVAFKHRTGILFFAFVLVFSACTPKPAQNITRLPEAGFSIELPENMEAANAGQLRQTQDVPYSPILPFTDFPYYVFTNPASGAVLVISKLEFANPETARDDPVAVMDEYIKNLEDYYQVDSITANRFYKDDYTLVIMRFLYEPAGETNLLIKTLYYRYPGQYALLDFYLDSQKISPEDAQKFEEMFNSIKPLE
jgi:hypothetical protein